MANSKQQIANSKPWIIFGEIFGKYLADYQDIRQINMIFGRLPWYSSPASPLNRDRTFVSCNKTEPGSRFVYSHKTVNTQTAIFGHLVTSPFAVPFGLYSQSVRIIAPICLCLFLCSSSCLCLFSTYLLPLSTYHLSLTTYQLSLNTCHLPLTTYHLPLTKTKRPVV